MENAHPPLFEEIRKRKLSTMRLKAKIDRRHQGVQRPALSRSSSRQPRMPSLIDIRRRIRSVKNTQQITKAMKMVSAAKLRRAQDRVIAARPYAAALRKVLANVAAAAAGDDRVGRNPLLARRPEKHVLLILITADKGLAGAFNTNLIKAALALPRGAWPAREMTLELIGRKGRDFFRKRSVQHFRRPHGLGRQAAVRRRRGHRPPRHGAVPQRRDRRGLPALQRIQERDDAEGQPFARAAGGIARRSRPPSITFLSSRRARCSKRCCRATWRWKFTARCWNRPRPSTPRA